MRARNANEVKWADLRVVPMATQFVGSGDPTFSDWQPGGSGTVFKVGAFQKDNAVYLTAQMPHNYKEGTDLKAHIHWTPRDRGSAEVGNYVGWKVDYSVANRYSPFAASATIDLSDPCNGTNHLHELTASVAIPGSALLISHVLMLKVYRSDTGADDTWVGTIADESPALLEFDCHYQIDDRGSDEETTKN